MGDMIDTDITKIHHLSDKGLRIKGMNQYNFSQLTQEQQMAIWNILMDAQEEYVNEEAYKKEDEHLRL